MLTSKGQSVTGHVTTSIAGLKTAQLPESYLQALLVAILGQPVALSGGILPLCRGAVSIFYSPSQLNNLQNKLKNSKTIK